MRDSAVTEAQKRAKRLYPRSKGFQGAYLSGAVAALNGRPIDRCPYKRDPGKTWRSAWRLAWIAGWRSCAPDE